jgi:hypothetical protein
VRRELRGAVTALKFLMKSASRCRRNVKKNSITRNETVPCGYTPVNKQNTNW